MQQHLIWYQETFKLDIRKEASISPTLQVSKNSQAPQAQIGEDYDGKLLVKTWFYTVFLIILNTNKSVNKEKDTKLRD